MLLSSVWGTSFALLVVVVLKAKQTCFSFQEAIQTFLTKYFVSLAHVGLNGEVIKPFLPGFQGETLATTECSMRLHGSISWDLVHLFSYNSVRVVSVGMFHRL